MKPERKRVFLGLHGQRGNVMSEEIGVAAAKVTVDVIKEQGRERVRERHSLRKAATMS